MRHLWRAAICVGVLVGGLWPLAFSDRIVWAGKLTMKDGRTLSGRFATIAGLTKDPKSSAQQTSGPVDVRLIVVLDDDLRRTFVSKRQVADIADIGGEPVEKIRLRQRVARNGARVGAVGPIQEISPFDQFGRRIFSMQTVKGRIDIVQGITEITPLYTKVESLLTGGKAYVWEMRIATSSLPRQTLNKILYRAIEEKNVDHRLKIVRLYLQSDRYLDARQELEKVVSEFPEMEELQREVRSLKQLGGKRFLEEIKQRKEAGQHQFAQRLLETFPTEGIAGETLQQVRQILDQCVSRKQRQEDIAERFESLTGTVRPVQLQDQLEKIGGEIRAQLGADTVNRLAAFWQLADDATLTEEERLSVAISGWLMGSNHATENLQISLSLYNVHHLVREYLCDPDPHRRSAILTSLHAEEGATTQQVAQLIAQMEPPLASQPIEDKFPGYFELNVPGLEGGVDSKYFVQLPPEYDPHRKYPLIVTLNGSGSTPELQIDWWAGGRDQEGHRQGQATRQGYITMAVDWQKPYQEEYGYSAAEHHVVLSSLRDACRRFSIDTDRVFLSGHSIGGDAAWDIGLAHPDLWAGVIPIVARGDRYCSRYWENAAFVPFYFVVGELDGDKMAKNSREFDRYLRRGFDVTVVEFLGRGHEHFYDEIQRIFGWMKQRIRDFFPKHFVCTSMRPWDNYFWWLEMAGLPEKAMVDPMFWPPPRGTHPLSVECSITEENGIRVKAGSRRTTVWLTPNLVDFDERITLSFNGRRMHRKASRIRPDLEVLLEDVRTRGDRLHPFWAKVELP